MDSAYKDERAIFKAALKKKHLTERAAYIKKACGSDSELLARVEALLKAHDEAGDFLEAPVLDPVATLEDSPLTEGPGTIIGRYKLLEKIGEGGFGVVYMADQTKPISRRVALKIIKLGMDTKEVIARFEAERQALAMMEHPNIAKVLDAGATDTGRPYFVMELVKGIPITQYCDNNNLDTQQRLELFINVCKAIQHAHQKGIIHRDLKPSNVMITLHDGRPVPKVIDFGIAKATGQRLTEKTLFTRFAQMIGTPEYMSPEQAEFSGLDVDTRSDIYSLGVILYQLLTGVTPFDGEKLREAGYSEMQRIIREDDPDKPSTKLSTMGEALTDVAKHRRVAPEALRKLIRGDLDWIVMKTLEKDRTRRYETASELASDIERHLANEIVLAGPPSTSYRLRKFVRRNRVAVMTGLLIAAVLLAAALISSIYAREAAIKANEAEIARQDAVKAQQGTAGLLAASYVDRAQALCEQGEIGRGMLWLADSLKIVSDDSSDLNRAVRTSLAAWYGQLHSLRAVVQYPDQINAVTFSPDGSRVLAACLDGTVRICDSATGEPIGKPLQHGSGIIEVVISSNGKRIATRAEDGSVRLWDAVTLESVGEPMQHKKGQVMGCLIAFTPDSSRLRTEGADGVARFWDAHTGKSLGQTFQTIFIPGDFWIDGVRVYEGDYTTSSNVTANILANGDFETGAIEPWSTYGCMTAEVVDDLAGAAISEAVIEGESCLHVMVPKASVNFWNAGLEHTGHVLKAGKKYTLSVFLKSSAGAQNINCKLEQATDPWTSFGSQIITITEKWNEYNITTPVLTDDIDPAGITFQYVHEGIRDAQAMTYCPDGCRVVRKVGWGKYQMFDADRGEPIGPPIDSARNLFAIAISSDGTRFAAGDGTGLIRIWEAETGNLALEPIVFGGLTYVTAFNSDGSRIVSAGNTRMALLRNTRTSELIGAPMRQRNTVTTLAFSPDDTRLVTGNEDGVLRIWDLIQNKYIGEAVTHEDGVLAADYGPDGLRILTGTEDAVQVRNAATGKPIGKPFSLPGVLEFIRFSPDGSRLVTTGKAKSYLQLWDLSSGELVGEQFHSGALRMDFSPDGSRILAGDAGGVAKLWDTVTLKCLGEFHLHRKPILGVTYSPDSSRFLTGSFDGTTQLWDAATLEPIDKPLVHQSEVKAATFSPDGTKFLIGFADGTIRLWDTVTLKPIGTPLQHLKVVCAVAFSPNCSQLLACCIDGTARLWDAATLKPIGPPLEHDCWWPTMSSFSADGSEILLADRFGTAAIWRAPLGPLEGEDERIIFWVQVVTGLELDPTGGFNVLDAPTWQQRCRRLQELGGPPKLILPSL